MTGTKSANRTASRVTRAGLIAAVYVVLCWVLKPISFGIIQLRVAEALVTLPILMPEAVPGVFVGALVANLIGGLGPWDVVLGSLATLVAAILTRRWRRSFLAYLPPIVINGLVVSWYLIYLIKLPDMGGYWIAAGSIALSETVVVFGLGLPLVKLLPRFLPDLGK